MFIPSLLSANAGPIHTTCMHGQLACSSGACHLLRDSGTDMAHIVQGVWSTVSAFVIDTRSLHSISDSVNAIRAMSAVSKEHGIMVQDTCEAAYKQHEVWRRSCGYHMKLVAKLARCVDGSLLITLLSAHREGL